MKRIGHSNRVRDRAQHNAAQNKARAGKAAVAWADDVRVLATYTLASELTESTGQLHVVDHVVPLSGAPEVCGLHTEDNLRVVLACDNIRKASRIPSDIAGLFFDISPERVHPTDGWWIPRLWRCKTTAGITRGKIV